MKFLQTSNVSAKRSNRVAGENKGICDEPINLKIFSNRVVDLTLVDLPGLTKVPVGDQPTDIEEQIKKLMIKYIENPNCIILAVTAANVDIATSEAIKFAKDVDPDGLRTLAVLTKLDLMDQGTDAIEVLDGNVLPVKLGIIGVINRSQKDINENKTIEEQLVKETAFFQEKYAACAERNGTAYLAKTLSKLLMNHIYNGLPDLKKRVNKMISDYESRLKTYGDAIIDKNYTLIRIITKFSRLFQETMNGTTRNEKAAGNTLLYTIIHEEFEKTLKKIKPHVEESVAITYLNENSAGPRPRLFDVPSFDIPFDHLVKQQIRKLKEPCLELIDLVCKEIKRNILHCGLALNNEWKRFPKLKNKIIGVMNALVNCRLQTTREKVEDLVDFQLAYINRNHPDFQKEKAIGPLVNYKRVELQGINYAVDVQDLTGCLLSETKGNKEKAKVLVNLVELYFSIVQNLILDAVPKAIVHTLVNYLSEKVDSELLTRVSLEGAEDLLTEADNIAEKRKQAVTMLNVYCCVISLRF